MNLRKNALRSTGSFKGISPFAAHTWTDTNTEIHTAFCTDRRIFRLWPFAWLTVCACVKCSMSMLFALWLAIWYWTKCKTWKQPQPSHYRELTELELTWHCILWLARLETICYVWAKYMNASGSWYYETTAKTTWDGHPKGTFAGSGLNETWTLTESLYVRNVVWTMKCGFLLQLIYTRSVHNERTV